MINRELIRLKVVQIVYAYYKNEGKTIEAAEKEFLFSLSKAYELYHSLLQLMVSIHYIGRRMIEVQQNRANRLHIQADIPTKFINNRFIAQLQQNEQLRELQATQIVPWSEEEQEFLRKLYTQITEQDFYKEYLTSCKDSYEEDRELWRKIYRHLLCNNEELDNILEERCLYWNDDKVIVDTFVLKTIRRFDEIKGAKQELLPQFKDDEDKDFALKLFHVSIENESFFRELIKEQTLHWDIERIASMDLVIMQVALAEIISFQDIPINVSINEYVEIAKQYSTPRSGSYINGMLDTIAKRLLSENKIDKA